MNAQTKVEGAALVKADPNSPCIKVLDGNRIAIKAGTSFNGVTFVEDKEIAISQLLPGRDYYVIVSEAMVGAVLASDATVTDEMIGGFHFAPGGNAKAALPSEARGQRGEKSLREGGDETPAINPCSVWDRNFRPACPDPRGMTYVDGFWVDIYLLGKDHLKDGTSKFAVTIADGVDTPQNPEGGYFDELDYPTAVAVMKHHGKQLLSAEESFAAYIGGKEKTSCGDDPEVTKWDAPRVSRFGINQPFGAMWQWGHDGDPDEPRPSIFGGSWFSGSDAGSRCAVLGYWPGGSGGLLGARGRSDHLQLG